MGDRSVEEHASNKNDFWSKPPEISSSESDIVSEDGSALF